MVLFMHGRSCGLPLPVFGAGHAVALLKRQQRLEF